MSEQKAMLLAVWTEKIKTFLDNVRALYDENGIEQEDIPQEIFEDNKPISIVFVGQYSAGKSTIVKALTGNKEIAIGEGIVTTRPTSYDWNGLKIVDTPGIHTTLRPDHDKLSYQAILDADMLVYVVTQELFDDYIGKNFRKLLIDEGKADEMILIVNKMAAIGNTAVNQEIKLKDLEKVTAPYTPLQLRTTFIDAESYLDSLTEPDTEIAELLRKRSNYEGLISTLNDFVEEKGIASQITTVLFHLDDSLQKKMLEYQSLSEDSDIEALKNELKEEQVILKKTKDEIESSIKALYKKAAAQIREEGQKMANALYDYTDEYDVNNALCNAYNEVEEITAECLNMVNNKISELSQKCSTKLDELYASDFSQNTKVNLKQKYQNGAINNGIGHAEELRNLGNLLNKVNVGDIKNIIIKVGHFFKYKFKPWEAEKIAVLVKKGGKVLGIFGVVFSFGLQVKEDIDTAKREQEMRKNRENIRAKFDEMANNFEVDFEAKLKENIENSYGMRIREIEDQISGINNLRKKAMEICESLEKAQSDCRQLISNIHIAFSVANK